MINPTIILNRKAITPLMITMLLISFAVAVGTGITRFGQAQLEEGAECAVETKMRLSSIGGVEQLCYHQAAKKISFTVENGVNIDITGLVVNVIGSQKAETFELAQATMGKAGSYVGNLPFDAVAGGEIRQVKITPKITVQGEAICIEQAVINELVPSC